MSTPTVVRSFVDGLFRLQLQGCFNPYADHYPPYDVDEAPSIRRANLTYVLEAAVSRGGVDDLWVGLELGHNGGRRTGLAMTDDTHLASHGKRFGVAGRLRPATQAGPVKEMTAGIVWQALQQVERSVFLWNVVPVHPHQPNQPLSNRRHNLTERAASMPYLESLIALLHPKQLVAIGKDASIALAKGGHRHVAVRHPAYGGKADFLQGIVALGSPPPA